jgi:putative methyltransferase (TIGR04325 family)
MGIKEFIPPVLIDAIRRNKKIKKYGSYSEALKACSTDAYQNARLCEIVARKTEIYIQQLKHKPYRVNPGNVFLANTINFLALGRGMNSISVLDFGGGCGAHYFEIRALIPRTLQINWNVVETPAMIQAAKSHIPPTDELHFYSLIEEVKGKTDLVHSSSALQYVPEPYAFTKKLLELNSEFIFVNRMMFNQQDQDLITVQQSLLSSNGPGKMPPGLKDDLISYPHTTMSLNKFNKLFNQAGYSEEFEFDESSGSYALGKEQIVGKGIGYKKTSEI